MTKCAHCDRKGDWIAYRTITGRLRRRAVCSRHRVALWRRLVTR